MQCDSNDGDSNGRCDGVIMAVMQGVSNNGSGHPDFATLITIIIVLAALTLFVATLIIRHSSLCLSLPAVMVVLSSMLSCQALPTFDAPVTI
jgi:hypothetical protein